MTAQIPDRLNLEYEGINLGNLALFGIATGDVRARSWKGERYHITNPPIVPPHEACSMLWRGYVATYCLRVDGRLELTRYDYPLPGPKSGTVLSEFLTGDFWLIMKSEFKGPTVFVPFLNGHLISDETAWVIDRDTTLDAVRQFQHPRVEEPPNTPLEMPVLLGAVKERFPHPILEDCVVVVRLDRPFPHCYDWCACDVRRGGKRIATSMLCSVQFCQAPNLPLWGLDELNFSQVDINDELWAIERQPGGD
ncbi:MAG: hypothetical protein V4719_04905 [Planctomycetota bacterium]